MLLDTASRYRGVTNRAGKNRGGTNTGEGPPLCRKVEKGSFTPVVFSTVGGMGPEAERFHKRLAVLIAEKRNETYSHVVNYIRTRLRFCLLKSILTGLRGVRGRKQRELIAPVSSLSFNLIQFDE